MKMNRPKRESNIELLRILATFAVIILHYNNPSGGGAVVKAEGLNYYMLLFLECISVNAVNVFVIISGYFMCDNNKRTLSKPIELIIQVILIKQGFYLTQILMGKPFDTKEFLVNFIPNNWFVILYIVIYLVSPLLNELWKRMFEKKIEKKALVLLSVLFLFLPITIDILGEITGQEYFGLSTIGAFGSQQGYTIVNFAVMYFIGAYIKNSKVRGNVIRLFVYIILLFAWAIIEKDVPFKEMTVWEYCNPIVVLLAIEVVLIFRQKNIGSNKIINFIAKGSFMVYLMHQYMLPYINVDRAVSGNVFIMLGYIAISIIVIYGISLLCSVIYDWIMSRVYKVTIRKIPVLVEDFYRGCF